ncbi:DUF2867 domain-containing protein [Georgenia faecalis]|uniref:DUF2867 domain-containing protein n=1 Tax=Georgenia faecalis TaxID=2483799 RepID=UPI0019D211E2|nr:DUF2867 domain-containing protein [Georgenia faecalis]
MEPTRIRRRGGGAPSVAARRLRGAARWSNRLPDVEHTARPWRIHQIAPDFEVEDVWAYRTPGAGSDDFPLMLAALRAAGGLNENPRLVRALFAMRWKLGALLGWDTPDRGLAGRVVPLRDRLPADLRQEAAGEPVPHTPFTLVYELADECVIELANTTVHDLCHLGWVPTHDGEYELRMAALVKPNGRFGRVYMAAIKPFRYLIVYPALTRKWERAWRERDRLVLGPDAGAPTPRPGRPERHRDPSGDARTAWAGRLIVFYGTAHTLGALTALGAARHAGAWFRRELWHEDLSHMSPAMSAYWLSVNSFGPPLVVVGLTVLWLNRRGIAPPAFLAWALGGWLVVEAAIAGPGVGQDLILLSAVALLLAARRARRRATLASRACGLAQPVAT